MESSTVGPREQLAGLASGCGKRLQRAPYGHSAAGPPEATLVALARSRARDDLFWVSPSCILAPSVVIPSEIRRAGERFMTIAAKGHRTSHPRQG
jgi:hypothetical protein